MEVREPSAKYLAKAVFKQTEAGFIPSDWDVLPLGKLGRFDKGAGLLKDDIQPFGTIPAIPYTALYTDFTEVVSGTCFRWFVSHLTNTYILDEPAVLIASSSNMLANTGKASALLDNFPVAIGREVIVFKSGLNPVFVSYLLSTSAYRKKTLTLARGTTIKHLYPATFRDYKVAVPGRNEQDRIATALSDADALIESLEQLLTKKRQIKQGAMQELLTAKRRLPGFEGVWETYLLGDLVSRLANGSMYQVADRDGVSVTRIETIATGEVDLNRVGQAVLSPALIDYKVRKHDILFSHINSLDHIGKVALFNGESDLYHGINLLLIRPGEKANGVFLYYWLSSNRARRLMRNMAKQAVSQASINTTELRGVALKIPEITEQTAIAAVLSDMDADIATLEAKLAKARAIKQGMMQELLTGRIRLV